MDYITFELDNSLINNNSNNHYRRSNNTINYVDDKLDGVNSIKQRSQANARERDRTHRSVLV